MYAGPYPQVLDVLEQQIGYARCVIESRDRVQA
jgi:hypothetical protein